MLHNKKTLLIFFGELRTFEYVIPHLKELDKVDIMVSTWIESKRHNDTFQIDEDKIYEIYKNVKYCNIIDFNQIENFNLKNNSWKLYYHWKTAINNLANFEEYDNIILHRCDFLSNWHSILDLEIKDDVIYLHSGQYPEPHHKDNPTAFWVNDYYFFGKPNIIKKFINLFNKENNPSSHFDMWENISQHNIQIENFILRGSLVRDNHIEEVCNTEINTSGLGLLTGPGSPPL